MSVLVFTNDEPLITAHFTDGKPAPVPPLPPRTCVGDGGGLTLMLLLLLLVAALPAFSRDFVGESDVIFDSIA